MIALPELQSLYILLLLNQDIERLRSIALLLSHVLAENSIDFLIYLYSHTSCLLLPNTPG